MLCPVDGEKLRVDYTLEKRAKADRRRRCEKCGFRCMTTEVITDTRAFVKALRKAVRDA